MGVTNNPRALVTGAAKRIGAAFAQHLAQRGFDLILHASDSNLDATALACTKEGVQVSSLYADFTNPQALSKFIEQASELGEIAVLINSAAAFPQSEFGALNHAGLTSVFSSNLFAPLLLAQQLPLAAGALVVNLLDSCIAQTTKPRLGYSLTKVALAEATQQTARLLAPNIRVNAICPGPVLPPPEIEHTPQASAYMDSQIAATPLQRIVTSADLMQALDYLLASPSVTGQQLFVDSGKHIA